MRTLRDGAARRSFLTKAATGGGLLTVGSMVAPISRFMPAATAQEAPVSDDVELAIFMAGLELRGGEDILPSGRGHREADRRREPDRHDVRRPPPGPRRCPERDHRGGRGGRGPDATLVDEFGPMVRAAADEAAILEIAFSLEEAAASTYLNNTIGEVEDARKAGVLATILPVESRPATVVAAALGKPASEYLIDFLTTDAAVDPGRLPRPEWPA